jgi:hypothetical protein
MNGNDGGLKTIVSDSWSGSFIRFDWDEISMIRNSKAFASMLKIYTNYGVKFLGRVVQC